MDKRLIMSKVVEILVDFFDDEDLAIDSNTVAADVDGWDSLAHISILSSLEDEFKIKFSVNDSQNMKCVGDIIDIIVTLME